MSEQYNGWTNRETWATVLHLTNTDYMYEDCKGLSPSKLYSYVWQIFRAVEYNRIRPLVAMVEDIGDLNKVNWQEVADALNQS